MRITLVFPPVFDSGEGTLPPLGLLSLAAVLRKDRHDIIVLDFPYLVNSGALQLDARLYERCAERILATDPEVVGFNTQSPTLPSVLNIAAILKRHRPSIFVVLGGPGVDPTAHSILERFHQIDFIIRGEGELSMAELATTLASGNSPAGLAGGAWRCGNAVHIGPPRTLFKALDDLPLPAYDLVPSPQEYQAASRSPRVGLNIELARGCCFSCGFCGCSAFWNKRLRRFSDERVLRQLMDLHAKFGVTHFYITDDNLTVNRRWALEFVEKIRSLQLPITWDTRCRLDLVDQELLTALRRAGCTEVLFGVESHDDKLLASMGKKLSSKQQMGSIEAASNAGLLPILSFIVGMPEESRNSLNSTLGFIVELYRKARDIAVHMHMLSIVPGTSFHNLYKKQLVFDRYTSFSNVLRLSNGELFECDETLIKSDVNLFSVFYNVQGREITLETTLAVAKLFPTVASLYPFTLSILSTAGASYLDVLENWKSFLQDMGQDYGVFDSKAVRQLTRDFFIEFLCQFPTRASKSLICEMAEFEKTIDTSYADNSAANSWVFRRYENDLVSVRKRISQGKLNLWDDGQSEGGSLYIHASENGVQIYRALNQS